MDPTSPFNPPPRSPASASPKVLWGVIGALVVAVAALGGVLLNRSGPGPATSAPAVAASTTPPQAPDDFKPQAMPAPAVPPATTAAAPAVAPPPPQAMAAAPSSAGMAPAPGLQPAPAPAANAPVAVAPPPCAVCGHVESVRSVQRQQRTTGVGAVAGGVVGGLVGNQFGHGNGRAATTVLGAVGGGFAGNAIERHVRTVTVYQVSVRMDSGKLRTVETATAPPLGKAVTLRNNRLSPADGRK